MQENRFWKMINKVIEDLICVIHDFCLSICISVSLHLSLIYVYSEHPPILDIVYERNIVRPDLQHSLWKYRPNINLEHLSQKIQIEGQHVKHRALVFFLKEVKRMH